ncbi:MAG: CCA tRNA nucleotidyltransferase [Bacilli bacterium]|jgi:tRNA nucleotidyltransferase (CCA-adding enzyme)|nr:CCA tRNA nucleotidyltransferase [Bacilli bacterium]MCH4235542.1 CCA tRNA nucleotidyltransferase [Bacilli bacterium]
MDFFETYLSISAVFAENGFHLYLVGGTVRDFLLKRQVDDLDFATDARPSAMEKFLPDGDFTFARYGTVSLKKNDFSIDITTFRREEGYMDARHPDKIIFVSDMEPDAYRRDFTINALYMDQGHLIYDFFHGRDDLQNHVIRMIGDPAVRLREDPLRILRALRFSLLFDFKIEENLADKMRVLSPLVRQLTPAKVNNEISKMMAVDSEKTNFLLKSFYLDTHY